jgi:Na+-transporting NADH:ubiquinone oxidoreductase subunit A
MPIRIRRGLDVPIDGVPDQTIDRGNDPARVALIGFDYVGMKPTMLVQEGDEVKLGQPLFADKKNEGVQYTSPGCGKVVEINRGEKRVFQSVVIELSGDEQVPLQSYTDGDLSMLPRETVRDALLESGLWTALRRRPYSKVPSPEEVPHAIFVQAMDTNPLAAYPELVINEHLHDFRYGLKVLKRLTDGKLHVCTAPGMNTPGANPDDAPEEGIERNEFDGPHPAGLPGTHIHFLAPVSPQRAVWYVNYQEVIAIGKLFTTGRLWTERVVSLAGPQVSNPRLLRTRLGASLEDLCRGELEEGENRIVSGSVLHGREAAGRLAYLGRYHMQVSVLKEGRERELLGWQMPGFDKFSVKRAFASAMAADGRRFPMTTNRNGSYRAIMPIGSYEAVMPLKVEPTYLIRSLVTEDSDQAQLLGALELDEEDLALCTFVDPGKHDFGPYLRRVLTEIELEG